jgi:hypothetical protein
MWQPAFARLQEVVVEEGLPWRAKLSRSAIKRTLIDTSSFGSPTIRVDGCDVDAWPRTDYGFGCRSYQDEGKISGLPFKEMLRS